MDTQFPINDASAARAWLAAAPNRNFSQWEEAKVGQPSQWGGLEDTIHRVTGLPISTINTYVKQACNANVDQTRTGSRLTKQEIEKVNNQVVANITAQSNVEWKDCISDWLDTALAAYLPRSVTLWKKTMQRVRARSEPSEKNASPAIAP